ncbi:MAG: hypothetical protein IKW86_01165 [Salinivirgaceae bacterium]|nr:hypothetical protein [Salinivirgaceae bacterium]
MKRLICTLSLAAFMFGAWAQPILFQEQTTINTEINGGNRQDDELLDIVFSNGGDRMLNYQLEVTNKVSRSDDRLLITIDNRYFKISEEYKYKGFDISQVLVPSQFSAELVLLSKQDKEIRRWAVEKESFEQHRNMVTYYCDEEAGDGCSLRIASFSLHFTKADVRAADDFISLIDNYFNTDARLKMMESELAAIRIDSIELLEDYHRMTTDNAEIFSKIKSAQYSTRLDLANYDPLELMKQVSRMDQKNREAKKSIEYAINHMYETYYNKGMDYLNWGKGDKAETMFRNSINVKSNYAPPHYQLALMDFDDAKYYTVLDTCVRIISDMNPDSDTRYGTIKLAERIIYIFLDTVSMCIEKQDVDGGFKMLSTCKNYCKKIKGIRNFEEFDKLSAQLYGTIHAKLIAQAQQFYADKNLKESLTYADSAANLRAEYPTFDIDATAESKLLNDLYSAWIAYGKKVSMENPEEALYAFDVATSICRRHAAVTCTSELEKLAFDSRTHKYTQMLTEVRELLEDNIADTALVMLDDAEKYRQKWELKKLSLADELRTTAYQIRYDGLMCEGDNAMSRKQPREALAFYAAAFDIQKTQPIIADTAWVSKNRTATIQYVIQLCSLGVSYAEMLQMGKAGHQYNTALAIAEDGKVTKEPSVQAALAELSAALSEGECSKAWFDYNVQIGSAERLIKQKEFVKARLALSRAASIARANYKCNLTDSVAITRANDIEKICRYQEIVNTVQPMLEQKDYKGALEAYVEATNYFADSCNNKFGINHKPIYDFVIESKYSGLIDYAVIYYAEINELKKSLKLLDVLYRRYYEAMWAKTCQAKIGVELARRDFREHPKADPKVKVLDYTRGDKWFNTLKKEYLQEWIDNSVENLKN